MPVDELGHGMLDLDPRVHLDEEELTALGVDEELDRARAAIADRRAQGDGGLEQTGSGLLGQARRRRLLDHLLAATLQRAVALVQMNRRLAIAENLNLDVTGRRDEPLDVQPLVVKSPRGLTRCSLKLACELASFTDDADSASAATTGRLQHHRVTDFAGHGDSLLDVGHGIVASRDGGHAGGSRLDTRPRLVAHQRDVVGLGPDEDEARILHGLREVGPFGEEAVAGMNRLRVALARCLHDRADVEIRAAGSRRTDRDRVVGHPDVRRLCIGLAEDGDRLEFQIVRGAN